MPGVGYRNRVLCALPATRPEIEAKTGVSKNSVWRWVQELHAAGECHIGAWRRPARGKYMPVYVAGPGKDKPCPFKPLTEAQKSKRHRRKARADGRWDERLAKMRARYWADRAQPDPLVAALFGR